MGIEVTVGGDVTPPKKEKPSIVRDLTTSRDLEALRFYEEPPEDSTFSELVPNILGSRQALWDGARSNAGFSGDCRHIWERVLDASFTELVQLRDKIELPSVDHISAETLNIPVDQFTNGVVEAQKKKLEQAHDKFDKVTALGIKRLASELSHEDLTTLREWGSEMGRAKAQAFRDLHEENMSISLKASTRAVNIMKDLSSLVRAKKPTSWSVYFNAKAKLITPRQKDYYIPEGETLPAKRKDRLVDYRIMSEEEKKAREDFLLQAMEDGFSTEMGKEEERTVFAEKALEVVETYQMILSQYQRALKKNRTRIIEEEQTRLAQSSLEEGFTKAASRVHEDIEDTMQVLDEAIASCAREYDHYITCIALHKENKRKMRGVVNQSIENVRQQSRLAQRVMLEQNVFVAGEYARGLENADLEKQIRVTIQRIRKDMFKELKDLIRIQNQMTKDEALVLDYQEPVALIEHKKELLALPAPTVSEREPE